MVQNAERPQELRSVGIVAVELAAIPFDCSFQAACFLAAVAVVDLYKNGKQLINSLVRIKIVEC